MKRRRQPRGSVLALAMILLATLALIGVMAISISSQERQNASAQVHYDALMDCANTAQAQLWSEVAAQAPTYGASAGFLKQAQTLNFTILPPLRLPDGTQLIAPAHSLQDAGSTTPFSEVVLKIQDQSSGGAQNTDITNKDPSAKMGSTYRMVAYCTDTQGRKYEVEFGIHLAL